MTSSTHPIRGHSEPTSLVAAEYELQLFIAGMTPRSLTAQRNIEALCERHLPNRYTLAVVDLQQQPERAEQEGVLGVPCLIKKRPGLVRRLVGDLSDASKVLKALGLQSA